MYYTLLIYFMIKNERYNFLFSMKPQKIDFLLTFYFMIKTLENFFLKIEQSFSYFAMLPHVGQHLISIPN